MLDIRRQEAEVTLVLDDGTTLEVAPESVPAGIPDIGEMLDADLVADLRLAAERKQVARLIFTMLDRRLHPVARIRDKAQEKGYSRAAVDAVLDQMSAKGLYSDRTFAEAYCRDCIASRAVGRRYLVARLRSKGVPAAIAGAAADEVLDSETEQTLARRAAEIRWRKIRGSGGMKDLARVVRHLQSRGFDPGTANRAARGTRPESAPEVDD